MHKRKRSEIEPQPPLPPPVVIPKRAEGPLFTARQALEANQKPTLLRVRSDDVMRVLASSPSSASVPFLGRFVWSPDVDAAVLLDGSMLRRAVGGRLEIVIEAKWLRGAGSWDVADPSAALPTTADAAAAAVPPPVPCEWSIWDLEALRRRKVWGTDVYTDDSDPLAIALHSGWIRVGAATAKASPLPTVTAVELVLRVAPKLVRYQGSTRAGVRSRSWANSHDGVSLLIESARVIEVRMQVARDTDASADARRNASPPQSDRCRRIPGTVCR